MKTVYNQELRTHVEWDYDIINPHCTSGLNGYLRQFFPRHFFKAQHAFHEISANCLEPLLRQGVIHILDMGCGPATAGLAVTDYILQVLRTYNAEGDDYPYPRPVRFCYTLVEPEEVCMEKAVKLINEYFKHVGDSCADIVGLISLTPRIIRIAQPFSQARRTIRKNIDDYGRPNVVLFSNVLVPILESDLSCQEGCADCRLRRTDQCEAVSAFKYESHMLSRIGHPVITCALLVQESGNADLLELVMPENIPWRLEPKLKQVNYDPFHSNKYYTKEYARGHYFYRGR